MGKWPERVVALTVSIFLMSGIVLFTEGQALAAELTVTPNPQAAGEQVTVTGTGFKCKVFDPPDPASQKVTVEFDGEDADIEPASPPVVAPGKVEFALTIPANTAPGVYGITVSCPSVETTTDVQVVRTIRFRADRDSGNPGTSTNLVGKGFDCDPKPELTTGPLNIDWEGDPVADVLAKNGAFTKAVTVPDSATGGPHKITARCATTGESASIGFVVIPAQQTTPTTPSPQSPSPPVTTVVPTTTEVSTTTSSPPATTPPTTTPPVSEPAESGTQRAHLTATLAAPSDLAPGVLPYVVLLLVAGAFALVIYLPLIMFPAEIFNKALEERHERHNPLGWPPSVQLTVFGALSALLLVLVEPDAAFDRRTAALGIGLMIAVFVTTLSYSVPGERLHRRISRRRSVLRTLPIALGIALVCALASRVLDFEPGYVYGLIAGYAPVARALGTGPADRRRHEGRAVLTGAIVTLVLSALSWLAWSRITVTSSSGFGTQILDSALGAITLMGVETVLFGLMPIKLLDGLKLLAWSRRTWATVYTAATVAYLVLLMRHQEPANPGTVLSALLLFLTFGLGSLAFWGFVVLRQRHRP